MTDKLILAGFSNMLLVDFHFHIDWIFPEEDYIEFIADAPGRKRHLRFKAPRNLHIEEGFNGNLSGMAVMDISARGWDSTSIEVINFEQDPGITFLAANVEIICNT